MPSLSLARQESTQRPRALVLGHPVHQERIAKELETLGFEALIGIEPEISQMREFLATYQQNGVQCIHPGISGAVSGWAERPEFAQTCQELRLACVAPSSKIMSLFANKLTLLAKAEECSIPTLVESQDPLHSVREIEAWINQRKAKLPVVLKSIRAGSGYGVFVVRSHDDLVRRVPEWIEQQLHVYGEAIVFPETYLESARRIIAPFARFRNGDFEAFSLIDASLQHQFRRLLDYCPARYLSTHAQDSILRSVSSFAESIDYVGVGSFEFFVEADQVYLINGACRLNHGFRLWEKVDDTFAIDWQLASLGIMGGGDSDQKPFRRPFQSNEGEGNPITAMGARIYCEDPFLQIPQGGRIHETGETKRWKIGNAEIELDMSVKAPKDVPPPLDGLLGLLTSSAPDPSFIESASLRALEDIWIAGGIQTNERFLFELMGHPFVKAGMFHAGFVDEDFVPLVSPGKERAALFASVVKGVFGQTLKADGKWLVGDQWIDSRTAQDLSPKYQWVVSPNVWQQPFGNQTNSGKVGLAASGMIKMDAQSRVLVFPVEKNRWMVRIGSWCMGVRHAVPDEMMRLSKGIFSLCSGVIHSIQCRENTVIAPRTTVLVIESFKSLIHHRLPIAVKIERFLVKKGDHVSNGELLAIHQRVE